MFSGARTALQELVNDPAWAETRIAYASRTDKPKWARECLQLIEIQPGGPTMAEVAAFSEIGGGDGPSGCKTIHFGKIQKASQLEYSDMIFFDDGMYNCRDVNPLGVLCVHVPDGVTETAWENGLQGYAEWKTAGGGVPPVLSA